MASLWEKYGDKEQAFPHISVDRRQWKDVRIFVSSTFTDFFFEREVLVKVVFPRLREWAAHRKISITEVDLRFLK